METGVFIDVLGWARCRFGQDIALVTCGFEREVMSSFNVPVIADTRIRDISADGYDALAIPGGFWDFGFFEEAYDERFLEVIREFDRQGKPIASVCVAALALGKSGILRGRKATTYHLADGERLKQLAEYGVQVVTERIVTDGNVITSYCPETAVWVAFELLERLAPPETTERVKRAMGYIE